MNSVSALDNPIWASLTSRHSQLAQGGDQARRYPPSIAPFAAIRESSETCDRALLETVPLGERAGILGVLPSSHRGWAVVKGIEVSQYVWNPSAGRATTDLEAVRLGPSDVPAMLDLTALVYPQYFRQGTAELGDYFGFVANGRLQAMAGIRMSFDGHQEISAVCTHPEFRGRGLASRLTRHLVCHIQKQGDTAFLHTESDNVAAKRVYERLGFVLRATLPFVVFERVPESWPRLDSKSLGTI